MAADISAQTYTTTPNPQLPLYGAPQQPSPIDSASATPTNVSSTSPRMPNPLLLHHLPLQSRQLRPPKSPLYVPAVLRPTERPVRQSPLTPPTSVHGSLDSLDEAEAGMSRRSTGDGKSGLGDIVEDEWMDGEDLGDVTGLPTKEHWKVSL